MSYAAEEWARAHRDLLGDDPCARAVLVELAVFHNRETDQCNPGQGALAKRLGYKKSQTVGEAIARLEQIGLITRTFKYSRVGTILCTDYTLVGFRRDEWEGDQIKPSLERVAQQARAYAAKGGMPNNGVLRSKQEGMPKNGIGYAEKRSRGTPLNGVNQGIEQGKNKERNKEVLGVPASSAPARTACCAKTPKATSPVDAPAPSGYEASLYAEADAWADQQEAEPAPEDLFGEPDAMPSKTPVAGSEAAQATHASPAPAETQQGPSPCEHGASEKHEKPKRKRTASSAVKDKPEDISQEVWDDWLTTRRAKRLPLTQTALNSVRREATSAGLTFQAAVTFAVEQGWAAFRAEWYRNATRKGDSTKTNGRYLTAQERYEERIRISSQMTDDEYLAQFQYPQLLENKKHAEA